MFLELGKMTQLSGIRKHQPVTYLSHRQLSDTKVSHPGRFRVSTSLAQAQFQDNGTTPVLWTPCALLGVEPRSLPIRGSALDHYATGRDTPSVGVTLPLFSSLYPPLQTTPYRT